MTEENGVHIAQQLLDLSDKDRYWVLAQINDSEYRMELESTLEKLDRCDGLERSPSVPFSQSTEDQSADFMPVREEQDSNGEILLLSKLHAQLISQGLEDEPDWVVVVILSAYDWPWKKMVVRQIRRKKLLKKYRHEELLVNPTIRQCLLKQFLKKIEVQSMIIGSVEKRKSLFSSMLDQSSIRLTDNFQERSF